MTHKTALSIALFATFGMTACSVDAPERENFDYSFQEEMPEDLSTELGFTNSVYDADIVVHFGDSNHGLSDVDPKVGSVGVVIESIQLQRLGADEDSHTWVTLTDSPVELDLMQLADGSLERIAGGPIAEGRYGAIAVEFSEAYVADGEGEISKLALPGMALYVEDLFRVRGGGEFTIELQLGALRSLERDGDHWITDPNVRFEVSESHD
jgi:hypothetical protein